MASLAEQLAGPPRRTGDVTNGPLGVVSLAQQLAGVLSARRLTLAVAEASTGGALADALTALPGASAFFLGGVVAYSNDSKVSILGVPEAILDLHGAVSPEAAQELARGVRRLFGSDLALSVTGILGPDGGTPTKPVGLTFVAVDRPAGARVDRHQLVGDRAANKRDSVDAALELLLAELFEDH